MIVDIYLVVNEVDVHNLLRPGADGVGGGIGADELGAGAAGS
jgi:hypothetical protein